MKGYPFHHGVANVETKPLGLTSILCAIICKLTVFAIMVGIVAVAAGYVLEVR